MKKFLFIFFGFLFSLFSTVFSAISDPPVMRIPFTLFYLCDAIRDASVYLSIAVIIVALVLFHYKKDIFRSKFFLFLLVLILALLAYVYYDPGILLKVLQLDATGCKPPV